MSARALTSRLITAAAREHLPPLGLRRRGASRNWFDDRGWWLINVAFQPSARDGTYLNIGAMWLWHEGDHWSFDEGCRLYWRADGTFTTDPPIGERGWGDFLEFRSSEQFAHDLQMLVEIAVQRVEQLRRLFPDPCAVARRLAARATRPGESPWWHAYHSGAAAAFCGDAATARHSFERIMVTNLDPDWAHELAHNARDLADLAENPPDLRHRLAEMIQATRHRLGLPPAPEHQIDLTRSV
jgi:hypothetical protein